MYVFIRGLKASGSKKELVKVLQEAMRQEEEKNGGKALKACRSDECQCVRDGKEKNKLAFGVYRL